MEQNQTGNIVILDEDRILLQSLSQFLSRQGFTVDTASTAPQAIALLDRGSAQLLLADINLPGIKPLDWISQLRRSHPQVLLVALTGYGSIAQAVAATRAGAFDYLVKPIVDEEIRLVVHKALRQQALVFENQSLKNQLEQSLGLDRLVGRDPGMMRVFELAEAVAASRATVMLCGESGTGKSLLAKAIHHRSERRDKPFVEVSCGALPESLLETELFGHVKGAFTGATADRPGRFFAADGGTIFLDEINSATPAMQVKLLRVLQERQFEPVGSTQTRDVDVRFIVAANVDLAQWVKTGKFRQDLYYRINVVRIDLPPLRRRADDIALLAGRFLRRFAKECKREILGLTPAALAGLRQYAWPGNVRELENAIERAVVLCGNNRIDLEDLPQTIQPTLKLHPPAQSADLFDQPMTLEQALEGPEKRILQAALGRNGYNRQATSDELGINRTTLYKKMRKYGLDGPAELVRAG